MKNRKRFILILSLLCITSFCFSYEIKTFALDTSGVRSVSDQYELLGACGQSISGSSTIADYDLGIGWYTYTLPFFVTKSTDVAVSIEYNIATLQGQTTNVYINIVDTTTSIAAIAISSAVEAGYLTAGNLHDIVPENVSFSRLIYLPFSLDFSCLFL